jgi:hypothetical protein
LTVAAEQTDDGRVMQDMARCERIRPLCLLP